MEENGWKKGTENNERENNSLRESSQALSAYQSVLRLDVYSPWLDLFLQLLE